MGSYERSSSPEKEGASAVEGIVGKESSDDNAEENQENCDNLVLGQQEGIGSLLNGGSDFEHFVDRNLFGGEG